jgi:hypothetical protein
MSDLDTGEPIKLAHLARELKGAFGIVLPKVGALAEPVIIVLAGLERLFARDNPISDFAVAAM